ncbi:MAG: hypothetical protein GWP17_01455 [Aquificales bacterium]|nr:hypothetical protein [Aquificales bacterium]
MDEHVAITCAAQQNALHHPEPVEVRASTGSVLVSNQQNFRAPNPPVIRSLYLLLVIH